MFTFIITTILVMFFIDITLSILNYNNRRAPIPENISDIYDKKDYKKWLEYTMEGFRLEILSKVLTIIMLLSFIFFGVFNKIAEFSNGFGNNKVTQTLIFLGIYLLIEDVLNIGFSIYRTFSIEERYGFNKTTVKTFIFDQIKNLILTIALGGGILYLILTLYIKLGFVSMFYAWAILTAVVLIIFTLYTRVFIKLFNKLTPLEDGELKSKATDLAKNLGYEIKSVFIMDASKRSTRMNAFFSGFGRFKSVILCDTLVEKCSTDEIVSVLAHEIGHSKHKDTLKNLIITTIQLALLTVVLGFFLSSDSFSTAFGFSEVHLGFSIILFTIMLSPIQLVLGFPISALSRAAEYKADALAASSGYKDSLVSSLKILAKENFVNLTPHPLVVKLTYSHPPFSERLKALEGYDEKSIKHTL